MQTEFFPTRPQTCEAPRRQRGQRHDLQQFFSPFWAAERLVERFFPYLNSDDCVIDCGTGPGAFLAAIPPHVPAYGVEIDPLLANKARDMTGREVICGDYRFVDLPHRPTVAIGNPPFQLAHEFLDRSYDVLPENGRCGYLLPAAALSFSGPLLRLAEKWSIEYEMLPRQLFPRARFPFLFVLFTKEYVRKLHGFFLFDEAKEIASARAPVKMVLMHGRRHRSTWRALIEDALDALDGRATRDQIRAYIAPRRTSQNPFWSDRVREIINNSGAFHEDAAGVVSRAAA